MNLVFKNDDFGATRLRLLVEQQKKWGDIRDIYDSHTMSYHEVVSLPPWIRDPNNGTFSLTWDLIQLVFLIYVSLMIPLRVCFDVEVPLWSMAFWIDTAVDAYFIIDLFMCFRTSYKREDGLMEDNWVNFVFKIMNFVFKMMDFVLNDDDFRQRYISNHYLKTWFILDFVSCIPVQYVGIAFDR